MSRAERTSAIRSGPGAVLRVRPDGRIERLELPAEHCLHALGWDDDEVRGRQLGEVLVSLQRPSVESAVADLAPSWSGLVAVVSRSGVPRPFRATLRLEADRVSSISLVEVAPHDPTDAARVAAVCSHAHAQERALLLAGLPAFCYSVDVDLVFTSSEGAGLRGLQLSDGQLVGTRLTDLWGTADPAYEPLACHLRALAGLEQTYQDVCLGRSIEYRIVPLRAPHGRVVGVLGLGVDVTEREAAKAEQRKLLAQLRQAQKMEAIGHLAGGVAHDFNNLLTCILGNLALAELRAGNSEALLPHLAEASAAAESAAELSRQLLAFGRKQVMDPRPVNVSALIERMVGMLQRLIGERILLRSHCKRDVWTVMADAGQLEQVLVNLVVNARDAIASDGEITIRVDNTLLTDEQRPCGGSLTAERYVVFSVADTGRGMSDFVRSKVFEPFFTTKQSGDGTGLGLFTVHNAIKQNGGAIEVESSLGAGSVFRIYLPACDAEPHSEVQKSARASAPPKGGDETILLVEDEPLLLELANCTLQQLGYEVLACSDADEALRLFAQRRDDIHLLVTDVVMPRMDGRELAGRITRLCPRVQVLYSSGYGGNVVSQASALSGSVNFLPKPYRPAELADKVRQVLDAGATPR